MFNWLITSPCLSVLSLQQIDALKRHTPCCSTGNTHGTGCTLASAIAAELAKGADPMQAVRAAKAFVTDLLRSSAGLAIGEGKQRPMNHGYAASNLLHYIISYNRSSTTHLCLAADHGHACFHVEVMQRVSVGEQHNCLLTGTGYLRGPARTQARKAARLHRRRMDSRQSICEHTW